jgi:hypothetical protein
MCLIRIFVLQRLQSTPSGSLTTADPLPGQMSAVQAQQAQLAKDAAAARSRQTGAPAGQTGLHAPDAYMT